MHVWGCPCYVLDPQQQDGQKLPKWKPRSCRGMFVGFSPRHSSLVPLVLNPRTGKISSQLHVIFDNWFTSVLSVGAENAFEPSMWQTLFSHSCYHYIFDDHDAISLSDDWTDPGLQRPPAPAQLTPSPHWFVTPEGDGQCEQLQTGRQPHTHSKSTTTTGPHVNSWWIA